MLLGRIPDSLFFVFKEKALIAEMKTLMGESGDFFLKKSLLLGIAYSASIGRVATLAGTPTNPIFVAIAIQLYGMNFRLSLG